MSDNVYVGDNANSVKSSPALDEITKVILFVDDEHAYVAGNDTGRFLEVKTPWGDQQMANDLLKRVQGFSYQPYTAQGAILDPAAEIGDGVTVGVVYSGIYRQGITFGSLVRSDIEAPNEEEIDHEYPYTPKKDREYTRKFGEANSKITQTSEQISFEVRARTDSNNELRSLIEQTADGLALNFTKQVEDVDHNVQVINSFLRLIDGKVYLGLEGDAIQLVQQNNKVAFVDTSSNTEVAYISNRRLYIPDATVENTMALGGYLLDASNGVSFKWSGG